MLREGPRLLPGAAVTPRRRCLSFWQSHYSSKKSPEQATNLGEVYGLGGINAGHSITAGHTESHGPPARGRGLRDPSPRSLVLRAPEGSQDEQK